MCFPRDPFPDKVKKCMCDHPIVESCFISKDFDVNTLLIIGNCCIKRFIEASSLLASCWCPSLQLLETFVMVV